MARVSRKTTTTARKGAGGRKTVSRSRSISASSILERPLEKINFQRLNRTGKKAVRSLRQYPIALSLAGTVGAFFLGRLFFRYYQNHPEISEFIKDNIDTVEGKLRDLRGSDEVVARH
jgi:hypothetical protein